MSKKLLFSVFLSIGSVVSIAQITVLPYPIEITCEAGYTSELEPPTATTSCEDVNVTVDIQEEPVSGGECAGKLMISYIYLDNCQNTATAQVFVTLKDTQEPEFYEPPQDIRLKRGDLVPFAAKLEAYDLSGMMAPVTFKEKQIDDVIYRTWTAIDPCGNKAEYTQKIFLPY